VRVCPGPVMMANPSPLACAAGARLTSAKARAAKTTRNRAMTDKKTQKGAARFGCPRRDRSKLDRLLKTSVALADRET
jgi:hypothetical protein